MDTLPIELMHMVCKLLDISDILSLRLANRKCSAVGIEHALPLIGIHLHQHSFERLRGITTKSMLGDYVHSLFYDTHTLNPSVMGFKEWRQHVQERDQWRKRVRGEPFPARTRRQWRKEYSVYSDACSEQMDILLDREDFKVLKETLPYLVRLKKITMGSGFEFTHPDKAHRNPYGKHAERRSEYLMPVGKRQLNSLLMAIADTGIKLDKLRAGALSWQFFRQSWERLGKMADACKSLRSIHFILHTGSREPDIVGTGNTDCHRYMAETSAIHYFLAHLQNLETLKLKFDFGPEVEEVGNEVKRRFPLRLEHAVGNTFWPRLTRLDLGCFEVQEETLLDFLDKHKSTLRFLGLCDVALDRGGSWFNLLPKVQDMLTLRDAVVFGLLYARGLGAANSEEWHIPFPDGWPRHFHALGNRLTDYLVNGGELPLNRDNMQFWDDD